MIIANEEMQEIVRQAKKFALYNRPVILMGETGTGKEVLAKFIHEVSGREGSLIAINPASISETLIESELFGHMKGSFTGANVGKKGLLDLADSGTVFFDEIAEMTLPFQAKLLRVVDGDGPHRFRPVGGTEEVVSNFRIICASNRPLKELVDEGKFLKDLFYRLQVFRLNLPPLRDRIEDIIVLTRYYLKKTCLEFGKKPFDISREAWSALVGYSWPGNIRELITVIARAVALCEDGVLELKPEHFGLNQKKDVENLPGIKLKQPQLKKLLDSSVTVVTSDKSDSEKKPRQKRKTLKEITALKDSFIQALEKNGWMRERTAEFLGLNKQTFSRYIRILKITPPDGKWRKGPRPKTVFQSAISDKYDSDSEKKLRKKGATRATREEIVAQRGKFLQALQDNSWIQTKTAETLKLNYRTFRYYIKILKITPPDGKWKRGKRPATTSTQESPS